MLPGGNGSHRCPPRVGRQMSATGEAGLQTGFSSPRDDGKCVFLSWMLMKNQEVFLKGSIEKFPFPEILEATFRTVLEQGLF